MREAETSNSWLILANRLNDLDGLMVTCVGSIVGLTRWLQRQRPQGVGLSGPTKGDVPVSSGRTAGRSRWLAGRLGGNFSRNFVEKSAPGALRVRGAGPVGRPHRRGAGRGRRRPRGWPRGLPRRRYPVEEEMPGGGNMEIP